jgi:Amt family ammonium transporter
VFLVKFRVCLSLTPLLFLLAAGPAFAGDDASTAAATIDLGDTAWMLTSTALVMLMIPGLALFYGGLVRRKNLLGTMMHSMVALAIIGVQWVLLGYCLAFGDSVGGIIGWNRDYLGLSGVLPTQVYPDTHIPIYVHCMFQGMFAIITPALISGALAERIRFGPYCLFIFLWAILVYDPLAHWVWGPGGWLFEMGALDFAGGTVVHIAAGLSGLAAILVLRNRFGYPEHAMHPSGMVLSLSGAGLLWFGWFGFNGGSGLGSGDLAALALTNTQIAAAAAGLSWMLLEWNHRGKPTALGLATGIVAGLVAITPAAGFVKPISAVLIGLLAGVICYTVVVAKPTLKYDDSLDAFGVHGVGGFLGALLTGILASTAVNSDGADGGLRQFGIQLLAAGTAVAYCFAITFVLVKVIDQVWGFCVSPVGESEGLDRAEHGEVGFDFAFTNDPVAPAAIRHANVPPADRNRFQVILEGGDNQAIAQAWTELCEPARASQSQELKALYPHVTTVQGNRFRFRDGDPATLSSQLEQLIGSRLGGQKLSARVES